MFWPDQSGETRLGTSWYASACSGPGDPRIYVCLRCRLIPQPAYSPEVNPVEHVWDELREKYFHNRIFPSLDGVIEALCQGLIALADDPQRLRSLTSFPHLNVLH